MKVLPAEEVVGSSRDFIVANNHYRVTVDSTSKYTTDISISQQVTKQTGFSLHGMLTPPLTVRIYHDAQLAEVINHDYHQRIKPSYGYPNPKMHHKDEKYQVNAFLHDWLNFSISHGEAVLDWDLNDGLV